MKLLRSAALAAAIPFLPAAIATAQPAQQQSATTMADYAGSWHLLFEGKPFATMTLQQNGERLSGSMTANSISMDENGRLTSAVAKDGTSSPLRAWFEDGALHLAEKDGDDEIEWILVLASPKAGELRFAGAGAPANAEAIRVEKLWSEPPVQP